MSCAKMEGRSGRITFVIIQNDIFNIWSLWILDSVTSSVQGMDPVKVETNSFHVGFFRTLLIVKELVSL